MDKHRVIRQIDIARYLGISRSAVACALTQPSSGKRRYRLNPATEALIKKTAADLGYRPSFLGLGLRHRKSFLVGLLNSAVNYTVNAELNAGIQEALIEKDYAPVVFTHHNLADEQKYFDTCIERNVEGLLANCSVKADGSSDVEKFTNLYREGVPIVEVFGRYIPEVPSVAIDYAATAALAVDSLWKAGHRRIALYIHDQYRAGKKVHTYWTAYDLHQGYCAAMKARDLEPCVSMYPLPKNLTAAHAAYREAFNAADHAIQHKACPTGFVLLSVVSAMALLDRVQSRHAERATAVRAVCLGSPQMIVRPTANLTLLTNPARKVGLLAARLLLTMIRDKADGKKLGHYPDIMISPEA